VEKLASSNRNQRKANFGFAEGDEIRSPISAAEASKSYAEAKTRNGGKKGHRPVNPTGRATGRNKVSDSKSGRSAKELGIRWIGSKCQFSPTGAHHSISRMTIDGGDIFECIYCHGVKWLPNDRATAAQMGKVISKYGISEGYAIFLDRLPKVKKLLSKLQDIPYLRRVLPDDRFIHALAAIMVDKDYPYEDEDSDK
jgi:hypothetical protein